MSAKLKYGRLLIALIWLGHPLGSAFAVSVEVAKKCQVLTNMAFPLRVPGNPAAGRTHGTSKDVQDYFNKCVTNGSNMEGDQGKGNEPAPIQSK
jgi:hypothetical protein